MRGVGGGLFLLLSAAWAVPNAAPPPLSAQETHVLIVSGLGGTEEYRQRFTDWAARLHSSLIGRYHLPADRVAVLSERPDMAPGVARARSTRENVLASLEEMAGSAAESDRVLLILIGHGTAQGDEGRFNLPGPDLSAEDLSGALGAFHTQTVAMVHTGSASGGFVAPLSGPNRIIVAATRTARERNATEFPRFFVDAVSGDGSDLDKDGRVSVLEAFLYARAEVERYYGEENELLTEHAVLDDNGDGEGSQDAGPTGPDGPLAATFQIGTISATSVQTSDDPVLAKLYDERREIQGRIDELRAVRDAIPPDQYEDQLEALLVELALKNREIRAREGGGP
jgi:hypothetical protein